MTWYFFSFPGERETEEVRRRAGDRNYPKKSRPHFVTLELGCDFSSDRGEEEEEDARRHLNRKQSVGNYVHIRGRHPTKPIVYKLREKESKKGTYYFLASFSSQQSTMCDVISLDLEITMQTTHYLYPNARIFHFFSIHHRPSYTKFISTKIRNAWNCSQGREKGRCLEKEEVQESTRIVYIECIIGRCSKYIINSR
jgi:hypothetical protein